MWYWCLQLINSWGWQDYSEHGGVRATSSRTHQQRAGWETVSREIRAEGIRHSQAVSIQFLSTICISCGPTHVLSCERKFLHQVVGMGLISVCYYINWSLVSRTHTNLSDRSFTVAGPRLWNNLPLHLPDYEHTLLEFLRLLKTHLFCWRQRRLVTLFFLSIL